MSSSQPFQASSPLEGEPRKKSRFTYRQLAKMATFSTSCPLRVIAHVDLDAFYAQCEMVRNNVPQDQPLAVQQWQGLIAINYPSRIFGLTRMITPREAKKLCPQIILQHVATWKEGDETWAYHDDAAKNMATHKVSLDPYRLESRRILACINETLPANMQKVEKAGIDEVFLDLSAQIHSILLERFPELVSPAPYDDSTEHLPLPPVTALDWQADALVDLDNGETEEDDLDWDDIAILIGSEIARGVRAAVRDKLKYTCSAGIAQNKMLAKLGSAHKKPNQQTVIRNRAVQQFLSDLKFTKIRGFGGKLGDITSATFKTEMVQDLLSVSVDQFKQKLGDDTGMWVYKIIRGIDLSEVSARVKLKSMLSAKSFRPSINSSEQASRWLRIFAADIYSRLVEEGVLENKRRPKTMNLHHRQGGQMKSRQIPIPMGRKINETMLFDLAKTLMGQIIMEGRVWPCANLSLSVAGFEDTVSGNMGIGAFLVKGNEAKALTVSSMTHKRRRLGSPPSSIQKLLMKTDTIDDHDDDFGVQSTVVNTSLAEVTYPGLSAYNEAKNEFHLPRENGTIRSTSSDISTGPPALQQQRITDYICKRCNVSLASEEEFQSHQDWHFAKDLQAEDYATSSRPSPTITNKKTTQRANKKSGKPEKGQTRLAFG